MYEAGDILIMPDGSEFRVMYISGNNTITLMNTKTKEAVVGQLRYLRKPEKVIKLIRR